jgi:thioester reductase-like protein
MQPPRKTYLLTGGTGFLGSLLSLQLLKKGNKIIFLGRSKNGEPFKNRIEKKLRNLGENVAFENIETLEIELSKKNLGKFNTHRYGGRMDCGNRR